MKTNLKDSLSVNKTLLILSLITILLGAISCVLGELAIPLIVGVLSALYLFDTKSKHAFSIVVTVILVALNVAAFILNYSVSLVAPSSIILALIISSAFKKGQSKSDAAYIMTIFSAVFALVGYLLLAMKEQGAYTFEAAIEYYKQIVDELRPLFVDSLSEIYASSGVEVEAELISTIFDRQIGMVISYLLIGGFIVSGIGMKIFSAIVRKCAADNTEINAWRFSASRVYAYFYVILVIASIFVTSSDSVFAVSILNLYNLFLIVFAYVGFNVALDIMKKRAKPVIATIMLIGVILLFASFAIQILAALGTLYSLRRYPAEETGNQ